MIDVTCVKCHPAKFHEQCFWLSPSCHPSSVSISRILRANRFGTSFWMVGTISRALRHVTIFRELPRQQNSRIALTPTHSTCDISMRFKSVKFKTTSTLLSFISCCAMRAERNNKYQHVAAVCFPSPAPDACWQVLLALWPGTPFLRRQALENALPALPPNAWHNFARALRGSNSMLRTGLHCICHYVCWFMLIQRFCDWK